MVLILKVHDVYEAREVRPTQGASRLKEERLAYDKERLGHDEEWLHKKHLEGPSSSPHMDQATVWESLVIVTWRPIRGT